MSSSDINLLHNYSYSCITTHRADFLVNLIRVVNFMWLWKEKPRIQIYGNVLYAIDLPLGSTMRDLIYLTSQCMNCPSSMNSNSRIEHTQFAHLLLVYPYKIRACLLTYPCMPRHTYSWLGHAHAWSKHALSIRACPLTYRCMPSPHMIRACPLTIMHARSWWGMTIHDWAKHALSIHAFPLTYPCMLTHAQGMPNYVLGHAHSCPLNVGPGCRH